MADANPAFNPAATLRLPCDMALSALISSAVCSGVAMWAEGDSLRVKGPKSAAALGAELVKRKDEVLSFLQTWNPTAAISLMSDVDGLVADLEVQARVPSISTLAVICVESQRAKDMMGLIVACQRLVERVRQLRQK